MKLSAVYIGGATRSPIGRFGGSLLRFSAPQLASQTLKAALARSPQAPPPQWVFLGHARQAGAGPNPARQATLFAGLSQTTPAITLNQACASGMTAIFNGTEKIRLGQATSVWSGGTESMSNTPYLLPQARWGYRMGAAEAVDGMYKDGFHCPMADMVMGKTVEEFIAREQKISRREQDEFALKSQQNAAAAWKRGDFDAEVFAIESGKDPKREPGLKQDEHLRSDSSLDQLTALKPVFDPKNGSITAGNSSGITDGAAFLHLSSEKFNHSQAEILDYQTVALDPRYMGLGPIEAIETLLKRQNLQMADLEAIEINEAFAAQVIACQRALKIPQDKLNSWGGSIALGHPIGCSGARIVVTLLSRLQGKSGALGLASLCVSGGMGTAILVKAL